MFIHNSFLYRTGTISNEDDYSAESGMAVISSTSTGTIKFALVDKDVTIVKGSNMAFSRVKRLTTQIDYKEITRLEDSGIELKPHNTILEFDDDHWRLEDVETFGQKFNRSYFPINLYQVKFRRITPDNA